MQQIIFIEKDDLNKINSMLSDGWKVVSISTFFDPVAACGRYSRTGEYGAYVVLEEKSESL